MLHFLTRDHLSLYMACGQALTQLLWWSMHLHQSWSFHVVTQLDTREKDTTRVCSMPDLWLPGAGNILWQCWLCVSCWLITRSTFSSTALTTSNHVDSLSQDQSQLHDEFFSCFHSPMQKHCREKQLPDLGNDDKL